MSTRLKRARKASSKPDYSQQVELDLSGSSSEEEESDQEEKVSKRKNSKKGRKRGEEMDSKERKGKAGKGKGKAKKEVNKVKVDPLDQLPFELVSEILSQLSPKDLLNFSSTNKQYRLILMSKNRSNSIWKSSRRKIGLPDLTAEDFSEPAYAALVFGVHCECCGRKAQAWADWWLRRRICKDCRRERFVRLSRKHMRERRLHPQTFNCVVTTEHSMSVDFATSFRHALTDELDYYSKLLNTIELDDENDLYAAQTKALKRSSKRPSRSQKPAGDDENAQEEETGNRVEAFVKNRVEHIRKVEQDGKALDSVACGIIKEVKDEELRLQEVAKEAVSNDVAFDDLKRSIEKRLESIDGYSDDVTYFINRKGLLKIVKADQALTDEIWNTIRSRVLAIIDAGRVKLAAKRNKTAIENRQQSRKRSLRPFYDSLTASLRSSNSILPLFIDFLLLPSVKPLWQDDSNEEDTIDDSAWKLLLPLIKFELEDYHLDSISSAVRLILLTNEEFENEEDLEEAVNEILERDLDSFFNLATSILVCDGGCQGSKKLISRISYWGHGPRRHYNETQTGFVGSFQEVIAHQHLEHNSHLHSNAPQDHMSAKEKKRTTPAHRFTRPLEVACAVFALLEIGQLDENVATQQDLDFLDAGWYRWDNSRVKKKEYGRWRDLIRNVGLASYKTERSRCPFNPDPPCIIYHPPSRNFFAQRQEAAQKEDEVKNEGSGDDGEGREDGGGESDDGSEGEGESESD